MKTITFLLLTGSLLFACSQKNQSKVFQNEKTDSVLVMGVETYETPKLIKKTLSEKYIDTGKDSIIESKVLYRIAGTANIPTYAVYSGYADTVLLTPLPKGYKYEIKLEYFNDGFNGNEKYPFFKELAIKKRD